MISALRRKLGGDKDSTAHPVMPPGVSRVDNELQKKYARGVQYNMKIVIRGDRNVGKTCLLKRLQGLSFCEEYVPTEEIQVVNIHWNYKATDDVVKVDVWDIVDQSTKKRIKNDKLKLSNNSQNNSSSPAEDSLEDAICDARFVDVYKGAHGIVLMFDLTKQWTWEYVQKEINHIPDTIPVIILANRRDMGHHRVVTDEMCDSFVDSFNNGFCLPYFTYDQFNLTAVPWSFLLRHGSALCLYGIAFAHWPGIAVTDWAETDRTLAIHLSAIIFVLTFWSACLYHYLVSAGRVQIDVRTGKIRGKGWVVRSSRRAHRVLLSLSLALSCMTLLQSIVTIMVITQFYLPEYAGKGIPLLILLKVDQTISLVIFIVALGRLFFEPVGLPKRKPEPINDLNGITKEGDEPSSAEVSLTVEMCNICDTNWSNRKLECGHLVCCCCLFRIWKETGFSNARCPYCRGDVYIVTKLHLIHGGNVDISSCCGLNRSEFADIERQSESLDYSVIAVPPPPESSNSMPDGSPRVRWTASSMRNAFGLRLVHLFFNIPFLCLQRNTLKLQLERNKTEIISSYTELDCYQETPEADYDKFMDAVTQRRRQVAESQGVKASSVTPSGRVMGGGQPIPGQNLSPEKTSRKPSDASVAETADSTITKRSPVNKEARKDSFEMLGVDDDEDEDDSINQFLDSSENLEKAKRPATLPIHRPSASDDENFGNTMVRTFEEDFYADDDLNEKMSKMAVEQKKVKKSTVLKFHEPPPPSVTPPAYHVNLESDNADSSNEEYITPDRTDSDCPITFTTQSSPITEELPVVNSITEPTESCSAFTTEDLDEWLGKEESTACSKINFQVTVESSDEEIGVKLPITSDSKPIVNAPQPVPMIIPNLLGEEKPKKKKKKTIESGTERKTKSKDGMTKLKKKSSAKAGSTSKNPQITLEEFLGGPILQDDQDYDPL